MTSSKPSDFFIYWGSGSIPCMQPMIVLEEKGFSGYGNKMISFSNKEHKSEEILKINPRGQVPTFKHGDIVLNESKGICHYLERQFKDSGTKLMPDEAAAQALVLQRMYEVDNIYHRAVRQIMNYQQHTKKEDIDEDALVERRKDLSEELDRWESYLHNGYVAGDVFTMADVFFFPYVMLMVRGSLSLESRPNLKKYYEQLLQRPSIQASWPPHYKETPRTEVFVNVQ